MDGLLAGGRQLTPTAWSVVQHGLSELLISPADKRRAGIALNKSARSTLMRYEDPMDRPRPLATSEVPR